MNASECCQTMGCNCAVTQSSEMISKMLSHPFLFGLGILGLGIIVFLIYDRNMMSNIRLWLRRGE